MRKKIFVLTVIMFSLVLSGCSVEVSEISLNESSILIYIDDSYKLEALLLPEDASELAVIWESSNDNVAIVDDSGLIIGLTEGEVIITAISSNGLEANCVVKVEIPVDYLEINTSDLDIFPNESEQLIVSVFPQNASNNTIKWKSSNTSVATVNSTGLVTGVGSGSTTITAESVNGKKVTTRVTVIVNPTSISLNESTLLIINVDGETKTLVATVYPIDATDKTVSWTSSNSNIASVNQNGVVTAVNPGTAIITASTVNGRKATSTINVAYAPMDYIIGEDESNNDYSTATEITIRGTSVNGENTVYDLDYYKLYLTAGETVMVILEPEYSFDTEYYVLGLLNSSEVLIESASVDSSGDTISLQFEILTSGEYYFVVMYGNVIPSPYYDGDEYTLYVVWGNKQ